MRLYNYIGFLLLFFVVYSFTIYMSINDIYRMRK